MSHKHFGFQELHLKKAKPKRIADTEQVAQNMPKIIVKKYKKRFSI